VFSHFLLFSAENQEILLEKRHGSRFRVHGSEVEGETDSRPLTVNQKL